MSDDIIFSAFMDATTLHLRTIQDGNKRPYERKSAYNKLSYYAKTMFESCGQVLVEESELTRLKAIVDALPKGRQGPKPHNPPEKKF
jgi:hypothetical protein